MTFEIIQTTEKLKRELLKKDLDEVTVGAWEIKVIWEVGYTEWYGPYRTKKDAQEAVRGMKKSEAFKD
jgi:uncharacterized protein YpmB